MLLTNKDVNVLISVLNVMCIKLCKSDLGCHCPDGDGIWWKRSGRCTQSKQQPAECSREYTVTSVLYCCNSLFNWFFSSWNWLMFWSVIKPNWYWRFCASFKLDTQVEYKGFRLLRGTQHVWGWGWSGWDSICGFSKSFWETPSVESAKEIMLSWERKRYSK